VAAALAGAGCSVTAVPIHGSDGKPYTYVDCSSMFQSLDDCYQEANRVCPSGYRIVNSVAPRANPFGNLVIECGSPSTATGSSSGATP
jgi:subtilase family serine protease